MNECAICGGRKWMVLQQHPMMREHDLVAPCLMCSAKEKLSSIEADGKFKLQRDAENIWREVRTND